MMHGSAAASITPAEWMDTYRPALYREFAYARRLLDNPENPSPAQRTVLRDVLALCEELLGMTEIMAESVDDRIRKAMLAEQARLIAESRP